MSAQIMITCPKCGGPTISKGEGQRKCNPCNYRFKWPLIVCKICGAPKSSGNGRSKPYCDAHYPTEIERHRMNRANQRATTPAAPSHVIKPAEPVKRAPGKSIVVDGDTIEITPDGMLVMNGGYPFPASYVEIALWKHIMEAA